MGAMFSRREEGMETTPASEIVLGAPLMSSGGTKAKRHFRAGMATGHMTEDVRMYLLGDAVFKARESKLESLGFRRCIDYPDLPSHVYYEGYFHTFASSPHKPVRSLNPRGGWSMDKPPAPPRLLAFAEAFRRCNADTLARVAASSPTLLKMYESGAFFADVAVQMHWGAEVSGERLGWHRDAPNSVLHLALGLAGNRTLHTCTLPISDTEDEDGNDSTADVCRPQHPGDVYMSSPFTFYHAVEYPRATWQSRVIAVQMRVAIVVANDEGEDESLVSTPSYTDLSDACSVENKEDLFAAIAAALVGKPLAVPTLAEVIEVEKELGSATAKLK